MPATLHSIISVPEHILYRGDLDGEAVLLNLSTGVYYGLDQVGASMWEQVTHHGRLAPAVDDLLATYEVTREQLEADLLKLIDELAKQGLIEIADGPPGQEDQDCN